MFYFKRFPAPTRQGRRGTGTPNIIHWKRTDITARRNQRREGKAEPLTDPRCFGKEVIEEYKEGSKNKPIRHIDKHP